MTRSLSSFCTSKPMTDDCCPWWWNMCLLYVSTTGMPALRHNDRHGHRLTWADNRYYSQFFSRAIAATSTWAAGVRDTACWVPVWEISIGELVGVEVLMLATTTQEY
jgi:hypothetical protein